MRILKLRGINVTKQQVIGVFEELSALNLGNLTLNRGRICAIEWGYDPRVIGKIGLGQAFDFKESKPAPRVLLNKVAIPAKPEIKEKAGSIIVKNGQVSVEIPANTDTSKLESIINTVRRTN